MQSAYEVLSDPQERAWYDSHRDAILRDEEPVSSEHYEHNTRITATADIIRIFTSIRGILDFTDSNTGFYAVLRRTFDTIAREEELACEWEGFDPITYPTFGFANDAHDDVVGPFYAAYAHFTTKKSFSWEDVYRYSEAPDRRIRRMMEKENKRLREEGVRGFNDAVRSLVAFVKKRDPRFKPNSQSEAERQRLLRDTAVAQAARSRAANQAKQAQLGTLPQWMKSSEPYKSDISDESEEAAQEQYDCVVCKKTFKSEKQYEAHEKSKKHVKAVQQLKMQMQREDKDFRLEELNEMSVQQPEANNFLEYEKTDLLPHAKAAVEQRDDIFLSNVEIDRQSEVERPDGSKASPRTSLDNVSHLIAADDLPESSSNDDYITRVEDRLLGGTEQASDSEHLSGTLASKCLKEDSDASVQPRMSKAKEKRAKKNAQKSTANTVSEAKFICVACQAGFPSKTRLFNHIKDLGHAQPVSRSANGERGRK